MREIAVRIAEATGAVAVVVERYARTDEPNVPVAWAGDTALSREPGVSRLVIAVGHRSDRLGSIVLWRAADAPAVTPDGLARLGELTALAALGLRRLTLEERLRAARNAYDAAIETKFRLINGIAAE